MASDGELISLLSFTLGSIQQLVKDASLLNKERFGDGIVNGTLSLSEIDLEKALIFDEIKRILEGYTKAIMEITNQKRDLSDQQ